MLFCLMWLRFFLFAISIIADFTPVSAYSNFFCSDYGY